MTKTNDSSVQAVRRSPVHEALEHLHPQWAHVNGMAAAAQFDGESADPKSLALCDVSALLRLGVKGPGAAEWLNQHGLPAPSGIYECAPVGKSGFVARTGAAEFFIEDNAESSFVAGLPAANAQRGVYFVQRQDASFLLSGEKARLIFAETCGVEFSKPDAKLCYSRVAGVSCAILHLTLSGISAWQLWCDNSYGMYLWETLLEIVREHGGKPAGLSAFYAIAPVVSGAGN